MNILKGYLVEKADNYIESFLDNATFKNINEPVALFFSYVDTELFEYYKTDKKELLNINSVRKNKLIDYLEGAKYLVVAEDDILASHPATIVVSSRGIQTPFLEPDKVKDFAYNIINDIESTGFVKVMSKVLAIRLSQLPAPELEKGGQPIVYSHLKHPDKKVVDYINYRYGKDFINQQYKYAWSQGLDTAQKKKQIPDIADLSQDLYSGRKFTVHPYYSYANKDLESRYHTYATPHYVHAAKFCGQKYAPFGLIHHYQKSENQVYYDDYAIEYNGKPETTVDKQLETIVVPNDNEYNGLKMYMDTRYYMIPDDEESWIAFKENLRASYIPLNEHLKNRRINILKEAKDNGNRAKTYFPVGLDLQNLLLENYHPQNATLDDVLIDHNVILKHYKSNTDFDASIKQMQQKVNQAKQIDNSKEIKQTAKVINTIENKGAVR